MRHNIKFAFRYLWRNKNSSLLNIAGLSLGITSALLLFLFIRHELSYDIFHEKGDRIYRVCMEVTRRGATNRSGSTPLALKQVLEEKFPQIEKSSTVFYEHERVFIVDPENTEGSIKKFKQELGTAYVQPSFYDMFDFKWAIGDYKKVLSEPNSAAISKSIAEKFFGVTEGHYRDVIGRTMKMNNSILLTVNGVIENPPANSDFPFEIVISQITHYNNNKDEYNQWGSVYSATNNYVLLKKGVPQKELEARLTWMAKEYYGSDPGAKVNFFPQPLSDLHFSGELSNYNFRTIGKNTLFALALIAAFLILTACINFINLSTAQAVNRSKEAGVKKTLGAGMGSLFSYFMWEIALIVFFSMALSVAMGELLAPYVAEKLEFNIEYNSLTDYQAFGFLFLLSIVVIFIAGTYPSFIMSRISPIKALHGGLSGGNKSGLFLRRSLVVFQFVLSQVLIIGVLVITGQIEFFRTKDVGFDKELTVLAYMPDGGYKQRDYLYNSLKSLPEVKEASFSFNPPSAVGGSMNTILLPENAEDNGIQAETKPVDDKYLGLYGLKLLAGRNFMPTDNPGCIVINETFMKKVGIKNPQEAIGFKFYRGNRQFSFEVIGVVKDFYTQSLSEEIIPVALFKIQPPFDSFNLMIGIKLNKFSSEAGTQNALKEINKILESAFPADICEVRFLDQALYEYYV
ncbi:MAG TPA: ABC transporter permease, partial [Ignavibacteriales bacterium]|nr:ABC transporter permease [Ignavibacteriales bacterium]